MAALLLPSVAIAQEEGEYYYTEYEREWYGWQTLMVDAPLLTTFFVAEYADQQPVALAALGGFVVGSPIVHLAHRNTKGGVVSASAHLLLPLVGWTLVRPGVTQLAPDAALEKRTAVATTLTGAFATVIDAVWLSYDETETQVQIDGKGEWWVPQVGWTGRGGWIGVGGAF